jgi:hypothetical protein
MAQVFLFLRKFSVQSSNGPADISPEGTIKSYRKTPNTSILSDSSDRLQLPKLEYVRQINCFHDTEDKSLCSMNPEHVGLCRMFSFDPIQYSLVVCEKT